MNNPELIELKKKIRKNLEKKC